VAVRSEEVLSAGAGLAATLVVGLAVLVSGVEISTDPRILTAWWAAYLVYVVVFLLDSETLRARPPWPYALTVAVLVVADVAVWLLAPDLGFTPLLFVVTVAAAAFGLPGRVVAFIVAVHTVAIAVGGSFAGWDVTAIVFNTVAFAAFQAFAALVVAGLRREAAARAELAAAHADLRAATALLATSSRAAERVRIARDLHDVMGHQLTALALELEVAGHRTEGAGREHVLRARGIAKDLLADVRRTVGDLREAPTDLAPTLRAAVERVPGLAVDLTVDERVPLDEAHRIAVVRAVQEIVTNTARHACARTLAIAVVSDDEGLVLRAQDDGIGAARVEPGNGLSGMVERFEELGGELTVESAPGAGFTVAAYVPVKATPGRQQAQSERQP